MSTSEYKRALLFRKAQGNVCRKQYFNKIHSFTNECVEVDNFLDLEETDCIINNIKNREIISRSKIEISYYKDLVGIIEEKTAKLPFYLLIDEEWKFCGAYKASDKLAENYDFDKLNSDEIRIIACDFSFQIQIDYDSDEIECEFILYK